jgi:hypothetical protein
MFGLRLCVEKKEMPMRWRRIIDSIAFIIHEPRRGDELDGLRRFLDRTQSGELILLVKGRDATKDEMAVLKREIVHLERIIARGRQAQREKRT